jgi:hypothetical protein
MISEGTIIAISTAAGAGAISKIHIPTQEKMW